MAVENVIPAAIRVPLAQPLSVETMDRARTVPMEVGELRRRDRFSRVPQMASVTWDQLTQAEFDTFWNWREADLVVLSRKFDLRLERQGGPGAGANPRIEWWTAQFVGMPQEEALKGGRYRVAATLMLLGDPFDVRIAPGIEARGGIQFRGRVIAAPGRIRTRGSIAFDGRWISGPPAVTAAGTITFDGAWRTGVAPANYRITAPDADTRATPEGDTRVHLLG